MAIFHLSILASRVPSFCLPVPTVLRNILLSIACPSFWVPCHTLSTGVSVRLLVHPMLLLLLLLPPLRLSTGLPIPPPMLRFPCAAPTSLEPLFLASLSAFCLSLRLDSVLFLSSTPILFLFPT